MNITKRRPRIKPQARGADPQPTPCRYYGPSGTRHGLVFKITDKFIRMILMEYPIKVTRVPSSKSKYIRPIPPESRKTNGQPQREINRIKRQLKRAAKEWGCPLSKEAKDILRVREEGEQE